MFSFLLFHSEMKTAGGHIQGLQDRCRRLYNSATIPSLLLPPTCLPSSPRLQKHPISPDLPQPVGSFHIRLEKCMDPKAVSTTTETTCIATAALLCLAWTLDRLQEGQLANKRKCCFGLNRLSLRHGRFGQNKINVPQNEDFEDILKDRRNVFEAFFVS